MPYCITLRSRTDATITGWYDGSDSRWSTDRERQKLFDTERDARSVCHELRSLCPRNAKVINIEATRRGKRQLAASPASEPQPGAHSGAGESINEGTACDFGRDFGKVSRALLSNTV
jgi:hypothetical protein